MPLNPITLANEIVKLTDPDHPAFAGFPRTPQQVAAGWARAARAFFAEIIVPPPMPALLPVGEKAFTAAMLAALGPPGSPTGAAALQAGFAAFAAALVPAAVPPTSAVPPPLQALVITPGPPTSNPKVAAVNLARVVSAWTLTGTYTVPPAGAAPWK